MDKDNNFSNSRSNLEDEEEEKNKIIPESSNNNNNNNKNVDFSDSSDEDDDQIFKSQQYLNPNEKDNVDINNNNNFNNMDDNNNNSNNNNFNKNDNIPIPKNSIDSELNKNLNNNDNNYSSKNIKNEINSPTDSKLNNNNNFKNDNNNNNNSKVSTTATTTTTTTSSNTSKNNPTTVPEDTDKIKRDILSMIPHNTISNFNSSFGDSSPPKSQYSGGNIGNTLNNDINNNNNFNTDTPPPHAKIPIDSRQTSSGGPGSKRSFLSPLSAVLRGSTSTNSPSTENINNHNPSTTSPILEEMGIPSSSAQSGNLDSTNIDTQRQPPPPTGSPTNNTFSSIKSNRSYTSRVSSPPTTGKSGISKEQKSTNTAMPLGKSSSSVSNFLFSTSPSNSNSPKRNHHLYNNKSGFSQKFLANPIVDFLRRILRYPWKLIKFLLSSRVTFHSKVTQRRCRALNLLVLILFVVYIIATILNWDIWYVIMPGIFIMVVVYFLAMTKNFYYPTCILFIFTVVSINITSIIVETSRGTDTSNLVFSWDVLVMIAIPLLFPSLLFCIVLLVLVALSYIGLAIYLNASNNFHLIDGYDNFGEMLRNILISVILLMLYSFMTSIDLKEIERKEARIQSLFKISNEALVVHKAGVITDANPAFESMFQIKLQDVLYPVPSGIWEFLPDLEGMFSGEGDELFDITPVIETTGIDSSGRPFQVEVRTNKATYAGRPVDVISIIDITGRKQLIEADVALRKAEAANEAKVVFLTTVSHELRTPINGVLASTEILERSNMDSTQKEFLNCIKISANYLLDLITDILDYSKIEAGKMELFKTDFCLLKMVEDSIRIVSRNVLEKHLELLVFIDGNVPVMLHGDCNRVKQIILNFLSNSIKFTSVGQIIIRVKLVLERTNTKDVMILFEVEDSGIGIKQEHLGQLFTAFSQIDSSNSRKYQGTGLGLSISKRLCRMMGGNVRVKSEFGKGSTFSFTVLFSMPTNLPRFTLQMLGGSIYMNEKLPGLNNPLVGKKKFGKGYGVVGIILDPNPFVRKCLVHYFGLLNISCVDYGTVREFEDYLVAFPKSEQPQQQYPVYVVVTSFANVNNETMPVPLDREYHWILLSSKQEDLKLSGFDGVIAKPCLFSDVIKCLYQVPEHSLDFFFEDTNNLTNNLTQIGRKKSLGSSGGIGPSLGPSSGGLPPGGGGTGVPPAGGTNTFIPTQVSSAIPRRDISIRSPLFTSQTTDETMDNMMSRRSSVNESNMMPVVSYSPSINPQYPTNMETVFKFIESHSLKSTPHSTGPMPSSSSIADKQSLLQQKKLSGDKDDQSSPLFFSTTSPITDARRSIGEGIHPISSGSPTAGSPSLPIPPSFIRTGSSSAPSSPPPSSSKLQQPPLQAQQQPPTNEPQEMQKEKILLVEDNAVNVKVFSKFLNDCGYTFNVAKNGIEAVNMTQHNAYDLILMDCQMPEMDGFEATQIIRKLETEKKIPTPPAGKHDHVIIIALTANSAIEDREKCIKVGMNDFLQKPVNCAALMRMIKKHME
eukprot:gene7379-9064_t